MTAGRAVGVLTHDDLWISKGGAPAQRSTTDMRQRSTYQ